MLAGAVAVASFVAAILTEIYLCNVCSCQEIVRRNGRGQVLLVYEEHRQRDFIQAVAETSSLAEHLCTMFPPLVPPPPWDPSAQYAAPELAVYHLQLIILTLRTLD
eukprot:SAG25_NODE_2891_length_1331_cov_0.860390_1_plen_106_part_00